MTKNFNWFGDIEDHFKIQNELHPLMYHVLLYNSTIVDESTTLSYFQNFQRTTIMLIRNTKCSMGLEIIMFDLEAIIYVTLKTSMYHEHISSPSKYL